MKRLLQFSSPDVQLISVAFICLIFGAAASTAVPHFIGQVIDSVVIVGDTDSFQTQLLYLILSALASAIFSSLRGMLFSFAIARFKLVLRLHPSMVLRPYPSITPSSPILGTVLSHA